ncbi:AMP-binding protein, partial [Streptomyces bohaiensis]
MLQTELIRPLHELLRDHAAARPGRIAYRDARRAVTYAELETRTARVAGALAAEVGVAPGDRVVLCLGNGVPMIESYLAVARAAAIGVPVNPASTDGEMAYLLTDSDAVAVITDAAHL